MVLDCKLAANMISAARALHQNLLLPQAGGSTSTPLRMWILCKSFCVDSITLVKAHWLAISSVTLWKIRYICHKLKTTTRRNIRLLNSIQVSVTSHMCLCFCSVLHYLFKKSLSCGPCAVMSCQSNVFSNAYMSSCRRLCREQHLSLIGEQISNRTWWNIPLI